MCISLVIIEKGMIFMTEQDNGTKRNVYFKSQKRYELFKAVCEELGTNISERLNFLIEEDLQRMIACVDAYKKSKENEKNEQ